MLQDDAVTKDGFLDNAFYVLQPAKGGHRAGLDAVLLAACVDAPAGTRIADFGAGCGVAGMAVASRLQGVTVDLVERDQQIWTWRANPCIFPKMKHCRVGST